jgi:hypothetical protein
VKLNLALSLSKGFDELSPNGDVNTTRSGE